MNMYGRKKKPVQNGFSRVDEDENDDDDDDDTAFRVNNKEENFQHTNKSKQIHIHFCTIYIKFFPFFSSVRDLLSCKQE